MMISLPSKWIKANNLSKGDEVDLDEKGNMLEIYPAKSNPKKEVEINITNLTESLIRTLITNAYRLGYDKIKLNFHDKSVLKTVQEVLDKNLIGFEIIKKINNGCEIENITEPSAEQFDNIFSKIFLNIDELFISAEQILSGKKQDFEDTERKIQQFDNFCRRVIMKSNSQEKAQLRWAFHSELIHGQREIYHMLRFLSTNKRKKEKNTVLLFQECKKIFGLLKKTYLTKDEKLIEKIHEDEKKIVYKKGYSLIKSNSIEIHHILSAIRNFYLASSPLSGLLISRS